MPRALICGVTGQDGPYLAKLLLDKGYEVWGTSRDAQVASLRNLERLGIRGAVRLESMAPTDFRSVFQVLLKVKPDQVYNLAGQSSVGLSYQQPVETLESITTGTLNLLEVVRLTGFATKLYNACSSECFGNVPEAPADERTPFRPRSPYALAKAAAFWAVVNYREAYGLFACSGILFNHESPLRPERFVVQKIVSAACRISRGSRERLSLGNLSIQRDWGWAPEYVQAMQLMLEQERPDDFVVCTGETHSLEEVVALAFREAGLEWRDHVAFDSALLRPSDIQISRGNPAKAREVLGWSAETRMPGAVRQMIEAALDGSAEVSA
jgi:GDPmannose 4,6-dehydratase